MQHKHSVGQMGLKIQDGRSKIGKMHIFGFPLATDMLLVSECSTQGLELKQLINHYFYNSKHIG